MIKINELDTSKSMLQDLTDQEANSIIGGAVNTNPALSNLMIAFQDALNKLAAQIAATIK